MNINFLSPLGKKAINNFNGIVDGRVNLYGDINEITHDGYLNLRDGKFSIPFLNLDYSVEDTKVDLNEQSFVFKKTRINDLSNKHQHFLVVTFHTKTSPIGQPICQFFLTECYF